MDSLRNSRQTAGGQGMTKEPQWRSNLEHPGGLMRPFGLGLAGPIPIPSYVQRWIALTSYRSDRTGVGDANMKQLVAEILTDACCSYYRLYAPPPPFKLRRGFTIRSSSIDAAMVQKLQGMAEGGVCVVNSVFAWLFSLPAEADAPEKFKEWIERDWNLHKRIVRRAGWPVMVLRRGDWPLDPRLIPGTPIAYRSLEGERRT
jgi:hypothetical protein